MPEQIEPLTVTVKEAARLLGVGPWTVYRMLDAKQIEETKIGGRRLVVYRSLVALTVPPRDEESA